MNYDTCAIIAVVIMVVVALFFMGKDHFSVVRPTSSDASYASEKYAERERTRNYRPYRSYRPYRPTYKRVWYEHLYPWNWYNSWYGYPSVYDPNFSVPYQTRPTVSLINPSDNCHRKCTDRYDYITNNAEYKYKVKNCINEYCY